jgi:hypothetical protein
LNFEAFGVINESTMETDGSTTIDQVKAEELLATATRLQAAFWDVLSDLEDALDGIEVSGARDLSETTIDELIAEDKEDDE